MAQPLKELRTCLQRQLLAVVSVVVAPEPSPTIEAHPQGLKGTCQVCFMEERGSSE
jgi:hypothetical protein